MTCEDDTADLLRRAGHKMTPQRLMIVRVLRHAQEPDALAGDAEAVVVADLLPRAAVPAREGDDVVVAHVQLAFLHALVEPRGPEDQTAQPVHERAVGGADELGPAIVHVLSEGGRGLLDLTVDGEVHEVLQLMLLERASDEPELA